MRRFFMNSIVVLSLLTVGVATASEALEDLVKLLRSQQDAALDFIHNSGVNYKLTPEEVDYMQQKGFSPRVIDELVRLSRESHPKVEVLVPAADQIDLSLFYETLAPYGEWVEVNGSWMWRPAVSVPNPTWRPYCDAGNWVYTDAGWAWNSDYTWGWVPFHYGRWLHTGYYGWVWAPGTTWGPAWVNWRTSTRHIGWAPLPPAARFEEGIGLNLGGDHQNIDINIGLNERDYCFVPVEKMCEKQIQNFIVPVASIRPVYSDTTVIQNNIAYVGNRVIVNGPSIEQVRISTRHDLQIVRLTDVSIHTGQAIHGDKVLGNTFEVYRPRIRNVASVTPIAIMARLQLAAQKVAQAQASEAQVKAQSAVREKELETERAKAAANAADLQKALETERLARVNAEAQAKATADAAANATTDAATLKKALETEKQARVLAAAEAQAKIAARDNAIETERATSATKTAATLEKALESERQARLAAEDKNRAAAEATALAAAQDNGKEIFWSRVLICGLLGAVVLIAFAFILRRGKAA